MRYRCATPTLWSLPFTLFGYFLIAAGLVAVWPVLLVGYLVRRATQRPTTTAYAAATVGTAPVQWTPFWNQRTQAWEYRLTQVAPSGTFGQGGVYSTAAVGPPRAAP